MASFRLALRAVAEFPPDRIPGALFHLGVPLALAVGGGPPRFEQIVGFLLQQFGVKILANQLHHGLPQFLVTGEIEDDVQARSSHDLGHTIGLKSVKPASLVSG